MKMRYLFAVWFLMAILQVSAQDQTCPININFSGGSLANWSATTGLIEGGSTSYPLPNSVSTIPEYTMQVTGIQVNTVSSTDHFGKFPTIPTVNGYAYNYSIKLGSSTTSFDLNSGDRNPGGFIRTVSYRINVPPGPADVPYTMTYAYALVLENGTHNSNEQPLFKATLETSAGVIACASPQYYLPTFNNAGSGGGGGGNNNGGGGPSTGATLDSAAALANGFTNSVEPFFSYAGQGNNGGAWLFDVWVKNWTKVTFDLSPYRGQQVTLTFEADNCRPGAHFAYAYVALRNTCAGLEISGPPVACTNTNMIYSVPALAGATYTWTVPADWTIVSGSNTNVITVQPGFSAGEITIRQINSCADLKDTLDVSTSPPTVAGATDGNYTVCEGINNSLLTSTGAVGSVVNWIQSINGTDWTALNVTGSQYNAVNLTETTYFAALLQNGASCSIDTATPALISVDGLSAAGVIQPTALDVCLGETALPVLQLSDYTGSVVNWQQSFNNAVWTNVIPANQQSSYQLNSINSTRYFRTIVQNGVCAPDTSDIATINYYNVQFPSASVNPDSSNICYGKSASLNVNINIGTSYSWSNPSVVTGGSGNVSSLPYSFTSGASPRQSTNLILAVLNAGCPNAYRDTVYIGVIPPVTVFAGNDTTVTVGQSMQFNATSNAGESAQYNWSPGTGLSNTLISNPIGNYTNNDPYTITYRVTVTTPDNCQGSDDIVLKVFKTGADIFVPSAFTPNNDGKNDKIIPIAVGIKQIRYFRVYNRWGQLVFSTSDPGAGWDGTIKGALQPSSTFVFMVEGEDYTGKTVTKQGSFVLLR